MPVNGYGLWSEAFGGLLHLFFPHLCAGCGEDLPYRFQPLCLRCMGRLPATGFSGKRENPVEKIFWGRLPLLAAFSEYFFTPGSCIQSVIHRIKYRGDRESALFMGRLMGRSILSSPAFAGTDLLVPLPLFADKERRRGYNQASLLCEGIGEATGIDVSYRSVMRNRYSGTQTHKSRAERWQNVDGVFCRGPELRGFRGTILLVDDVITTGATMEACGRILLDEPGIRLSIASLAYTML